MRASTPKSTVSSRHPIHCTSARSRHGVQPVVLDTPARTTPRSARCSLVSCQEHTVRRHSQQSGLEERAKTSREATPTQAPKPAQMVPPQYRLMNRAESSGVAGCTNQIYNTCYWLYKKEPEPRVLRFPTRAGLPREVTGWTSMLMPGEHYSLHLSEDPFR